MTRLSGMFILCAIALLCGCAQTSRRPEPVAAPAPAQSAMFEAIKKLEGSWMMNDESGQPMRAAVFEVTSGGSVVRETMFPDTAHEMTNMYHMDGPRLVMTHYCAAGNQPRMAASGPSAREMDFQFDSVTNLTKRDDHYMGAMRLVIVSDDEIEQHWTSLVQGEPAADHAPVFKLARQR